MSRWAKTNLTSNLIGGFTSGWPNESKKVGKEVKGEDKSYRKVNRLEDHSTERQNSFDEFHFYERGACMKPRHLTLIIFAVISLQIAVGTTDAVAGPTWNKNMSAIKQELGPIWVEIPSSSAVLSSISVTPKYNGYVLVTATGTVSFTHTAAVQGNFCLDLSDTEGYTGGCGPMAGSDTAVRSYVPASFVTSPDWGFGIPYSIVRVFPVTAGVTETFYLNGYAGNLHGCSLFQPSLTALFVPAALP